MNAIVETRRALCGVLAAVLLQGCGSQPTYPSRFELIAHRGAHPYYYGEGNIDRYTGCSATLMKTPEPAYIENTIPAVAAAFRFGATMVEIDVHRTADNELIVFHDAMLECRTDGRGSPGHYTLGQIRQLDAGYGYTADGGKTFPFRGNGVGLIPTLSEMLDAFPHERFLIDPKEQTSAATQVLIEVLARYSPEQRSRLVYWGGEAQYRILRDRLPELQRLATGREMMRCAKAASRRLLIGRLPEACSNQNLILPAERLRPWFVRAGVGWPNRFLKKVNRANSFLYIDTDSAEEAVVISELPIAGILTDRIEVIGPLLAPRLRARNGGHARGASERVSNRDDG